MAPSPLHGLNIVHTETETANDQYADNTQDPLLANANFPDLAAQLDLWSNLTFQTDEPPAVARKPLSLEDNQANSAAGDDKDDDSAEAEGPAPLEAHVDAVNPASVSNPQLLSQPPHFQPGDAPNYDMGSFLAGFGIEQLLPPSLASAQPPPTQQQPPAATLAQLLAAYPFAAAPFLSHTQMSGVSPAALSPAAVLQQAAPMHSSPSETASQTKRASRQRKASSSTATSPSAEGGEQQSEAGLTGSQTLSAAEDKRRRNTAASARFRLKKKEREAALERRAQELEQLVNTLERECEGLRRENGWLKGLVVGVTGAGQGAQVAPQTNGNGSGSGSGSGTGTKRKRAAIEDAGASATAKDEKETKKAIVSS